jgi:hypothetical protein
MPWFRLRPTFDIHVAATKAEMIERLTLLQSRASDRNLFLMFGEYGELHLPSSEHRLWSPHLSFYISQDTQRTTVHGRFAPRIDVWTVIWIAYLVFLFTAFFGIVLGLSQWSLGEMAWGMWVAVVASLLWLSLFVIAHVGQQWSSDQMHKLRDRLQNLLDECANTQAIVGTEPASN